MKLNSVETATAIITARRNTEQELGGTTLQCVRKQKSTQNLS
jgi:hypothetical protein